MNKGKLIAGIIWLVLGAALVWLLLNGIQRVLIAGVELIDDLGGALLESSSEAATEPSQSPVQPMTEEDFDVDPAETMEPEELFSIPVDQTAEELAKENEPSSKEEKTE